MNQHALHIDLENTALNFIKCYKVYQTVQIVTSFAVNSKGWIDTVRSLKNIKPGYFIS